MSIATIFLFLSFGDSRYIPISSAHFQSNILTRSVSINESTGPSAPAWVEGPSGRGTYEILQSCIATLLLCGFTAVAINVHPTDSKLRHFLRRAWWMVVTIIAPEYVLWCAFDQFWTAKELRDEINRLGQRTANGDVASSQVSQQRCRCYWITSKKGSVLYSRELERQYAARDVEMKQTGVSLIRITPPH